MRRRVIPALTVLAALLSGHSPPARGAHGPAGAGPRVIELGGEADQVRSGGAGRYFVSHLKDAEKLAVVDVVAGKRLGEVPARGSFLFAANRDKLIVVLNDQRVVQRWDLQTLRREKTVLLPDDRPVRWVAMGSAGAGPLALWSSGKVQFWDVASLKPLAVRGEVVDQEANVKLWPSADGLTFCGYGWSTVPYAVMRLGNVTATSADCTMLRTPDGESFNEAWAMPSADGSLLVRHGARFYTGDMAVIDPGPLKDAAAVYPTADPRFLLSLRRKDPYKSEGNSVAVVAAVDRRVLYTVPDVEPVTGGRIGSVVGRLGPEPRVHYLPGPGLLVTIPDTNDRVVVRRFDLSKSLASTGADYLFVISKPPTRVGPGAAYAYQVQTLSSGGGVKCRLEEGPEGMTVSDAGLVEWRAPAAAGKKAGVILAVSDASGEEVIHTIELSVTADTPPEAKPSPGERPGDKPESPRDPLERAAEPPAGAGPGRDAAAINPGAGSPVQRVVGGAAGARIG